MTQLILDPAAPLDSAQKFRALERPHVIRQQGTWYDCAGTHYRELEKDTVATAVQKFLEGALRGIVLHDDKGKPLLDERGLAKVVFPRDKDGNPVKAPFQPHPGDVHAVVDMLAHGDKVHKEAGELKPPVWLDGRDDPHEGARLILPCRNGLFDLDSRKLLPHTPDFFCTYCLPIGYDPDAPVPELWLRVLGEMMDDRPHLVEALQGLFGYTISQDRSREKIVLARGRSRSGKSTLFKVLVALCGASNTASLTMSQLGERYGLENCVDKLLLLIPDLSISKKQTDLSTAGERLKSISGLDPLDVRRMKRIHLSNILFPGQFWIGANILPDFGDNLPPLIERLLIVPFDADFRRNPDVTLKKRLVTPDMLAGILNWSIEGLDRLNERGQFKEWPESIAVKRELLAFTDPLVGFVNECCELKTGTWADIDVLYRAFADYAGAQGLDLPLSHHFSAKHVHMLRHGYGYALANAGHDTRRIQDWLGHRSIQHTVRYSELSAAPFKDFWRA
jgi:P4 family phage/plasmid primase-like protien